MGSVFKERLTFKNLNVFGISIMIISIVGFLENILGISNMMIKSTNLMIVIFSLISGSFAGEALHIDEKLSNIAFGKRTFGSCVLDATLFFGVGGLQISGPVLWAVNGDNSQLLLKSIIDFPFALMFGASYGKSIVLSAIPVAFIQAVIAVIAYFAAALFNADLMGQICAMGYIVLFFSGFNLISENKYKINNTNMIPGIFIVLLFHMMMNMWRVIK